MVVEKQRAGYEQKLLQMQQQMEVLIREKTFLEAHCAGLDRDYNAALVREAAVTEEAAKLRQEYSALKARYDTVEQNLSASSEELAEDKIGALRYDCLFLSQEKSNLEGQIKQLFAIKTD